MGRISRGYAITALVFGCLELLAGISLIICAILLSNKVSSVLTIHGGGGTLQTFSGVSYWWGGAPFILPGILGIVTFCTRSATLATCHLIFNILSFLVGAGCTIIGVMLVVVWGAVVEYNKEGKCVSTFSSCVCPVDDYIVNLGASCDIIISMNSLFLALTASAAFGSIVILIACYINCVSLCNQEQNVVPGVVLAPPGTAMYQTVHTPQPVAGHTGGIHGQGNMGMQPPAYNVNSNDKAQLVYNEA